MADNVASGNGHAYKSYLEYKGKFKGIGAWIFSTDHKRIGLLYLWSIMTFFIIGVALGFFMRLELFTPGPTITHKIAYIYTDVPLQTNSEGQLIAPDGSLVESGNYVMNSAGQVTDARGNVIPADEYVKLDNGQIGFIDKQQETTIAAQTYNSIFTLHGIIMIFLVIIPGIPAGFGNFFMPIQIGAPDVSFPNLNLMSWWLYMIGGIMAVLSVFIGDGPIDTGWTFYAPYSVRSGTQVIMPLMAAFILGFSSILTGLNFVTTIHRLRAPGMSFFKMPLFVWATYSTAWIQIIGTPVIGITILLVVVERAFGVGLFDPAMGGDPILFQHLFWIYSHPAVYIMILPAMGVVSEIIPTFSRKTIFGYGAIAMSSLAIAFVGTLVWGHHMFTSGMSDESRWIYSFLTFIVALPSGVKIFNWVATMYKGSIKPDTPFLYVMAFIFLFSIGGLTGLVLGALATDVHLHDTYFVVAHFHYVMFGGTVFIFFAGLHYWWPKMFGKMYNEKIAKWALGFMFVGFNMLYFTMFILGYLGMPRRYFDSLPEYVWLHQLATVGSWVLIVGILMMFINLFMSFRKKGYFAKANPWGGMTLEWTVPSPPPQHNFLHEPTVKYGPYEYEHYEEVVKSE